MDVASEVSFILFSDINTVFQLSLSKFIIENEKLETSQNQTYLQAKIKAKTVPRKKLIFVWQFKAELEILSGIPGHLFSLYKITGEHIHDDEEIFDYLKISKCLNAKIETEWIQAINEAVTRKHDDTSLVSFMVQKTQDAENKSFPNVGIAQFLSVLLFISARQGKEKMFNFLVNENSEIYQEFDVDMRKVLQQKTIFQRNMLIF